MPIPTTINDLNIADGSNSPAGSDQVFPDADNYFRAGFGMTRRLVGQATAVASAATVTVPPDYGSFHVTGTTTITAFASTNCWTGRAVEVVFDAATPLTHNATSFILPGSANITAAAGDVAKFYHEGSGNWRCMNYRRGAGNPAFVVYRSGSQAIPTGAFTKVQFNAEEVDTHSFFDSATNYRFLPTVSGYYQINLVVQFPTMVAGNGALIAIYKNGSQVVQTSGTAYAAGATAAFLSDIVSLNGSTDYVEGYVFHSEGADRNITGLSNATRFSGMKIANF